MAVLGGRARIFRRTSEKKGNFEAWKLGSGAKVTGRIKMAEEGSVHS